MTLQQEIQAILNDSSLSYDEKGAKLVTKQELNALLPKPKEVVALKEPLQPKTKGMKNADALHPQGVLRRDFGGYEKDRIQRLV